MNRPLIPVTNQMRHGGRWQISDPLLYFKRLRDERSAQSRLDDDLESETLNAVANHALIELVRTTKDRVPIVDESLKVEEAVVVKLGAIEKGRQMLEDLLTYIERQQASFSRPPGMMSPDYRKAKKMLGIE